MFLHQTVLISRYEVRGQDIHENISQWWEDAWYYGAGENSRKYYLAWPPFALTLAHLCFWTLLFLILYRYRTEMGRTALRYFVLAPIALLLLLTVAMTLVGFDFTNVVTAIANATMWIVYGRVTTRISIAIYGNFDSK